MKKIFIVSITVLLCSTVLSQTLQNDVIASAGESDTTNHVQVSWTIGETIIETYNNPYCIVSQGFQQSYYNISEINETGKLQAEIKIYPNPTVDFINIEVKPDKTGDIFDIELLDINGKIIQKHPASKEGITRINLRNTSAGYLILNITNPESKLRSSYKVIKTNY